MNELSYHDNRYIIITQAYLLPSSWTVLSTIKMMKLITRRGLPRTELNDHTSLYNNIIIMQCTYKTNPITAILALRLDNVKYKVSYSDYCRISERSL